MKTGTGHWQQCRGTGHWNGSWHMELKEGFMI